MLRTLETNCVGRIGPGLPQGSILDPVLLVLRAIVRRAWPSGPRLSVRALAGWTQWRRGRSARGAMRPERKQKRSWRTHLMGSLNSCPRPGVRKADCRGWKLAVSSGRCRQNLQRIVYSDECRWVVINSYVVNYRSDRDCNVCSWMLQMYEAAAAWKRCFSLKRK